MTMKNKELKKYYCSKHKNEGNPNCNECWNNLKRLCKDNNAYLSGERK